MDRPEADSNKDRIDRICAELQTLIIEEALKGGALALLVGPERAARSGSHGDRSAIILALLAALYTAELLRADQARRDKDRGI